MKMYAPKATKSASVYVTSAALKAGERKRSRSMKGSASVRCRRRNTMPRAVPPAIVSAGSQPGPYSAMRLTP